LRPGGKKKYKLKHIVNNPPIPVGEIYKRWIIKRWIILGLNKIVRMYVQNANPDCKTILKAL
uniref:Gag polyprotein n=1 Tax=Human immunodeficiency virus type 1 TaxID=11676 RepID=Q7LYY3_HV1